MNTIFLQAEGGNYELLIMMAAVFAVMYFFMIRPQKKREKELAKKRDELKKGDDIITAGGVHGKVFETNDDNIVIVVESQAKLRIEKSSVAIINGEGAAVPKK